ncbi:dihydroorotase [Ectothiorhodospiraceae bacterium WFHF3C12]|nr:dihydroorotase [Ectothiorhodospiraceae bacterium WFHF3C12]
MSGLLIRGGRLIDPANGIDTVTDLYVVAGHVAGIGERPEGLHVEREIDAAGQVVCPGLIDLAARPREPGHEHKADITSEAHAAVRGGITTLVCPPDTQPVLDTASVAELIHRRAEDAGAARILPVGALTLGLAGEHLSEMATLRNAGCRAVGDGGRPVADSLVLRRAMEYAATFDLPVMLTPADRWLSAKGCVHEGHVATRLGLTGIPEAAEAAALGRDLALVAQVGTATHFGRLSTATGAAQLREARRRGLPVSADAAVHQLFLTEMDVSGFASNAHVRPPLRTTADRDALRQAVAEGDIEIICSDHQPHESDAKDGPLVETEPGVSGLDTLLALLLRLVDEDVLDLSRAIATATAAPARLLGLDSGRLDVGAPADITVFDPDRVWYVTPEQLRSRGHNTPFRDWELTGRVTHALVGGRHFDFSDT